MEGRKFSSEETLLRGSFDKLRGALVHPDPLYIAHSASTLSEPSQPGMSNQTVALANAVFTPLRTKSNAVLKPKRSKFEPTRRMEVAKIRKKGACMRCRLDKLPVPPPKCHTRDDYTAYLETAVFWQVTLRNLQAQQAACIWSPFETPLDALRTILLQGCQYLPDGRDMYNAIMERSCHHLITNDIQLEFQTEVDWDLNTISQDFARWISDQQLTSVPTSRVGILCSFTLTRLLSFSVKGDLSQNFRLLMETSSALYNRGVLCVYAGCSPRDLWRIKSFAGVKVLDGLEKALSNNALSNATLLELKALFLVLFGTIIAVGYSGQWIDMGDKNMSQISTGEFMAAQRQLILILTHHMIEIADRVSLFDPRTARNIIIEDAYVQWKRMAVFGWREIRELGSLELTSVGPKGSHDDFSWTQGPALLPALAGPMSPVNFPSPDGRFLPDRVFGPHLYEALYDCPWTNSLAEPRRERITKCFVHDHLREFSYTLSYPKHCTFVSTSSLTSMLEAYEAQNDDYRLYRITTGAWQHNANDDQFNPSLQALSYGAWDSELSLPHTCNVCNGLLYTNGICENCSVAASAIPHIVSMRAYGPGICPMNLEPKVHISVTEAPPAYGSAQTPLPYPETGLERSYIDSEGAKGSCQKSTCGKVSQWECNCTPPASSRQLFLAQRVHHIDLGSLDPSLSSEGDRPLNLLI